MLREVIQWHDVSETMPDSDITVLICTPDADEPVWLGWHDGTTWFAVDATEQPGVKRWAQIPAAQEAP